MPTKGGKNVESLRKYDLNTLMNRLQKMHAFYKFSINFCTTFAIARFDIDNCFKIFSICLVFHILLSFLRQLCYYLAKFQLLDSLTLIKL